MYRGRGDNEYAITCPGMADKVALIFIIASGDSAASTELFTSDGASMSINNKDIRQRLDLWLPNSNQQTRQHCLLNGQLLGVLNTSLNAIDARSPSFPQFLVPLITSN